ncbi:SMI1/KNR4 family protein [Bacillus cereus]
MKIIKERFLIRLFLFAIVPSGNLICFDYKNYEENPIVIYGEHEGAWEEKVLIEGEGITTEEVEKVSEGFLFLWIQSLIKALLRVNVDI